MLAAHDDRVVACSPECGGGWASGTLDTVVVWRFDRFARNTAHLIAAMEEFRHLGVDFISLREQVDTSTPMGKAMFTIISAISELERDLIRERVVAGVLRARAAGKHCGRPRVELDLRPALAMLREGRSLKEVSTILKVPRATLRRRLRETGAWSTNDHDVSMATPTELVAASSVTLGGCPKVTVPRAARNGG